MRTIFLIINLFLAFNSAQASKVISFENTVETYASRSCLQAGQYGCSNSNDCCGTSRCNRGVCGPEYSKCLEPGQSGCATGNDCCGSSSRCNAGTCGPNLGQCLEPGQRGCSTSNDCCGSSRCNYGACGPM